MGTQPLVPVVTFNPAVFLGRYPEFTAAYNANPALYQSFFDEAGLYVNNTSLTVVQNYTKLGVYLNMVTAHIAFLAGQLSADGQARPVGRVSSATEGSVSASFEDVGPTPGTGAWFLQSQYGAAFWQATTCYRGMQYSPQPTQVEGFTGTRLGSGLMPGSGLGSL
jgi:hypothetical protein